jgi:hypothetical protein
MVINMPHSSDVLVAVPAVLTGRRHMKDSVDVSLSIDMRSYLVSAKAYRCSLTPWIASHQIPDSHGILLSARFDWAEC